MLKLYYGLHNSIRIYKRGIVAAYHVVWECVVEQWLGVCRTPAYEYHTTTAKPQRNTNTHRTRAKQPMK